MMSNLADRIFQNAMDSLLNRNTELCERLPYPTFPTARAVRRSADPKGDKISEPLLGQLDPQGLICLFKLSVFHHRNQSIMRDESTKYPFKIPPSYVSSYDIHA
jgi:hypothetical protein